MESRTPAAGGGVSDEMEVPATFLQQQKIRYAWLLNDQMGARQQILDTCQVQSMGLDRVMHSKGELDLALQRMAVEKPDLLWIRLAGWGTGSGHRVDRKRASLSVTLAIKQLSEGRHLILEGNRNCGAWTLTEYQDLLTKLHCTQHAYCNYGVKIPGTDKLSMRTIQLATTFQMNDCRECRCGQPLGDHGRGSSAKVTASQDNQMRLQVLQGSVLKALELYPSGGHARDHETHGSPSRASRALTMGNPTRMLRSRQSPIENLTRRDVRVGARSRRKARTRTAHCRA